MSSKNTGHSPEAVFNEAFDQAETLTVLSPSSETLRHLISTLQATAEPPAIRVIGEESDIDSAFDDFVTGGLAAEFIENGALEVRTTPDTPTTPVLLGDGWASALIVLGDNYYGLEADSGEVAAGLQAHADEFWEGAAKYQVKTPSQSRVLTSLEEQFGEAFAEDFNALLDEYTDREMGMFDAVAGLIILGSVHEELLYDISKWGEDIRVASKATFSRVKTELESDGVIDTEKVPIDVGRPRQRLVAAGEFEQEKAHSVTQAIQSTA